MKIRRLVAADKGAVMQVFIAAYQNHSGSWSEQTLADNLNNSKYYFWGVWQENQLLAVSQFLCVLDSADLVNLAVHPDFQNQNLGNELLKQSLARLQAMGISQCFLEVRESNLPAKRLYEKNDFALIDHRPHYYRDTQETALVYQWKG